MMPEPGAGRRSEHFGQGQLFADPDLGGYDPVQYTGGPEAVVPKVMVWLATRPDADRMPTPEEVLGELPKFQAEKTRLQRSWKDQVSWADLVLASQEIFRALVAAQLPGTS